METEQNYLDYLLNNYGDWETADDKEDYLVKLEITIEKCNEYANKGLEFVPDSIYDVLKGYLKELYPDSTLLTQNWTEDTGGELNEQYDRFLKEKPMLSIRTIKSLSERSLKEYTQMLGNSSMDMIYSAKLNGWGIRVVIDNGVHVKSHTRGRSSNGRDITGVVENILEDVDFSDWSDLGLVELRGEVLLPFYNLDEAREFNPDIKSPFTAVSSLIKPSSTKEENQLLDIVFYNMMYDGDEELETLESVYEKIEEMGLTAPYYENHVENPTWLLETLDERLEDIEEELTGYPYFLDGIIMSVNNRRLFIEYGQEDNHNRGNVALKVGAYSQNGYVGEVAEIKWTNGKSKKTPVAVLKEPVKTANGTSVTNVPLYAPMYILLLEAYPGNLVYFNYGGEAGVVPTTPTGELVKNIK